jgi:hypothetical protein
MFTPDQYAQIANSYATAAADPFVSEDKRQEFARRAEWFRYLAAREKDTPASGPTGEGPSRSPRKSIAPFLTTLWLAGAGLYLIGTLLFTNAIGLFGDDGSQQVSEVSSPAKREPQTGGTADTTTPVKKVERPHAISPDQPSYEAPELTMPATENTVVAPLESAEVAAVPAPSAAPEMFKVSKAATIRNGPSATAKVIGTATPGAELQVTKHEGDWIQFVDPSSGNSGWIESSLVADANGSTDAALAPSEEARGAISKKSKRVKAVKQKSPSRTAEPRSKPWRGYAELPQDEEFLADRGSRRMGLFARRRMLRDGLMSPEFLPP